MKNEQGIKFLFFFMLIWFLDVTIFTNVIMVGFDIQCSQLGYQIFIY
jgi:hypothetical protein